ncbi:MAG: oligoendopeptidase F, partial [Chloroflexia bacterium]|nr:oligoendopeptidase F [Chloroflexia bacterium]
MVDMIATDIPTRDQISLEDTWDLTMIYPDEGAWEAEYGTILANLQAAAAFRGRLGEGTAVAREALDAIFD